MKPKTKITKQQRIEKLERELLELKACSIAACSTILSVLPRLSTDHLMASGVVINLSRIGGADIGTVCIRDGFSKETIEALNRDIQRSKELAKSY